MSLKLTGFHQQARPQIASLLRWNLEGSGDFPGGLGCGTVSSRVLPRQQQQQWTFADRDFELLHPQQLFAVMNVLVGSALILTPVGQSNN